MLVVTDIIYAAALNAEMASGSADMRLMQTTVASETAEWRLNLKWKENRNGCLNY
jgi:hypothetical protein